MRLTKENTALRASLAAELDRPRPDPQELKRLIVDFGAACAAHHAFVVPGRLDRARTALYKTLGIEK